jgi:prephenate dehydrogenase
MRIAFLGFGLIGGSLARAVRARGESGSIVAWSPSGGGPRAALADGIVDEIAATASAAIDGADLVVLAAPPVAALDLLRELAGPLRSRLGSDTTITDVVSTKVRLVNLADRAELPFVGGHPMAGRETTGYGSAQTDLFVGRPWVITAGRFARDTDVERVEELARAAGANPIRMSAEDHDRAVAAISHLPLVLSAALVEAVAGQGSGAVRPDWPAARALAASGWRDMTRLARGDVEMGAGIAATNAGPLAARLQDVRAVLDGWIADLEALETAGAGGAGAGAARAGGVDGPELADTTAIAARLRDARARLEHS